MTEAYRINVVALLVMVVLMLNVARVSTIIRLVCQVACLIVAFGVIFIGV